MGEKEEAAERGAQQNAFIGRARELSELRGALEQSLAGRGSCFLISGEPGIGKTRLADELAADAASRGVRVAWGLMLGRRRSARVLAVGGNRPLSRTGARPRTAATDGRPARDRATDS